MIRRAEAGDVEALIPLIKEFYAIDGHTFDEPFVRDAVGPLLEDDWYGVVWLVEDDGLLGYAVVTWGYSLESGGMDALLDEIYLRDRGAGWGTELIECLLEDCRNRGLARLCLETEARNERVRRFYGRHGFVIEDSVWMRLDL